MDARGTPGELVIGGAPRLYAALRELAETGRLVFFAGLPGTGKSLLLHQLAHLAHGIGRQVHLLQWDVARPVFEACGPGRRYPQDRGVTHGVIRLAVGGWARQALVGWDRAHGAAHLLIGETPFVGHRLVELARSGDDAAEPLLEAGGTRFVVPVPSREVRRHLEAERARRARRPLHDRETEDAPPEVLRDLWRQLASVARALGVTAAPSEPAAEVPYDPEVYQGVYARVLARRRMVTLPVETLLPTAALSVYDFRVPTRDLIPTADEAARFVETVEAVYGDPEVLRRTIERWWAI
ncbi:MAG TPA: hypothetical protein VGW35_14810 [Methylomirabilota bacterium]|nr:hypothetical protein [Methylomirabilota bacterium]